MNRVAVSALEGRSDPESTSRYLTPTMTPVDSLANDSVNGSGPSPTTDSIESQPDVSGSAARNDPRVQRLLVSRRRRLSEALRRAGIDLMVTDNPVAGIWLDLDPRAPTLAIDHDGWTRLDPEPHPLSERLARLNIPQTATVGTDAGASHDLVVQASRLTGELSDATTAFRVARAAKDALELSLMRRAFAIAESAASDALETAGPGSIELDLAHAFERHARLAGADGQSYELSVATGHRTSRPWAGVTTTELEVPGPLQVDLGVWFKRYR
ncbi:MAG: peptidase, partial [Nocardioides sp.]|nr:peptidase [Nocardioides sp.]